MRNQWRLVVLTVSTAVAMACCFVALSSSSSSSAPTELLVRAPTQALSLSTAPTELLSSSKLFVKNWKALTPDGVAGADIRESRNSDRASRKAAVRDEDRKLDIFFGIQHFPGSASGLAKARRAQGLRDAGAQDLSSAGARTTQLDGLPGYMDPTSYLQKLQTSAVAGQVCPSPRALPCEPSSQRTRPIAQQLPTPAETLSAQASYMKKWAHKNRVAALGAVKDAGKRYKKWMLINPNTGRAPLNLHIPHDTEEDAVARLPGMARQQALMDVTADNGESFTLPWCASLPGPHSPIHRPAT